MWHGLDGVVPDKKLHTGVRLRNVTKAALAVFPRRYVDSEISIMRYPTWMDRCFYRLCRRHLETVLGRLRTSFGVLERKIMDIFRTRTPPVAS